MNNVVKKSAAVAALALLGGCVLAQTPPPAPAHQGLFSRLFHPKPKPGTMNTMHPGMMGTHPMMGGHSMMGMHPMMGGQLIGNKNTHVYHVPGDKGSLPSPQNRVYFSSAAAAQAAGYHVAGGMRSTASHRTMMHGSTMHPMPMQR